MATGRSDTLCLRDQFQKDGFFTVPEPGFPEDLVSRARDGLKAVAAGEYETGVPPKVIADLKNVSYREGAHLCNGAVMELITHPALAHWAGRMTDARMIQVWGTLTLVHRPAPEDAFIVGWHRDFPYWNYWRDDSEVFGAWIALTPIEQDCAPLVYVPGSQHWCLEATAKTFGEWDRNSAAQFPKDTIPPPGSSWREVPFNTSAGGLSFHHKNVIHGSGTNESDRDRVSITIFLRTERAYPRPDSDHAYLQMVKNPELAPVIVRR